MWSYSDDGDGALFPRKTMHACGVKNDRARAIDDSVSMATVYRTLSLLDEMDLVIKHEFKEGFARFEVNAEHHHHMIDLETGDVIEFQNEELEALKEKIAVELGYDLIDHTLELYGRKIKKK